MPNNGVPSPDQVLAVLSAIQDPDLGRDVVSLGMIKDLVIGGDGRVSFTFELTTPACPVRDRFQTMATKLVGDLPGVTSSSTDTRHNTTVVIYDPDIVAPADITAGVDGAGYRARPAEG